MSGHPRLEQEEELVQACDEESLLLDRAGLDSLAAATPTKGATCGGGGGGVATALLAISGAAWHNGPVCILGSAFVFACAAALVKSVESIDPRVSLFQVGTYCTTWQH